MYITWGCLARLVDLPTVRAQQAKVGQGPGAVSEPGMAKPENGGGKSAAEGCACLASKWLL